MQGRGVGLEPLRQRNSRTERSAVVAMRQLYAEREMAHTTSCRVLLSEQGVPAFTSSIMLSAGGPCILKHDSCAWSQEHFYNLADARLIAMGNVGCSSVSEYRIRVKLRSNLEQFSGAEIKLSPEVCIPKQPPRFCCKVCASGCNTEGLLHVWK